MAVGAVVLACALLVGSGCSDTANARPAILVGAGGDGGSSPGSLIAGGPFDATGGAFDAVVSTDALRADLVTPADVALPATDVVAVDVPIDPRVDVCGDGVDNNRDGRVDEGCPATACNAAPVARTRVRFVGAYRPTSLPPVIAERRLTLEYGGIPTRDELSGLAALIVTLSDVRFDADAADRIRAWVDEGGALVSMVVGFGNGSPAECDNPNVLLSRFAVTYGCGLYVPWGPITTFAAHPITASLTTTSAPFVNGRTVDARPGVVSTAVALAHTLTVGRAFTSGCGRVLVWGDEHVSLPMYGDATRPFWSQTLGWLLAR